MLMTLLLYNGNCRQTKQLHQYINKLHRKLNFTLETEVKNSMNFRYLTITKTDNRLTFNIYRKPTTTVTVIHNISNHPTQHKHATFHSMVNRLLNLPLNQTDYNTKVNTIKYFAQENGYVSQLIESQIKNAKGRKLQTNKNESHTDKRFITVTHHNKFTQK